MVHSRQSSMFPYAVTQLFKAGTYTLT